MNEQNLQTIDFHGQTINVVYVNGEPYVIAKPIAESLGISWRVQRRKIVNDPRYHHMVLPLHTAGGIQSVVCIPLSRLDTWLFSISVPKVRPEVKQLLQRYQDELSDLLYRHSPISQRMRESLGIDDEAETDARPALMAAVNWQLLREYRLLGRAYAKAYLAEIGVPVKALDAASATPAAEPPVSLEELFARIPDCKSAEDERYLYFLSDAWSRFCEGFNPTHVARFFRDQGVLLSDHGHLTIRPPSHLFNGQRPRVYALLKAAFQPPTTH